MGRVCRVTDTGEGRARVESEKLRYLLIVAEEGSISKAADRLYMSQSSLSKAIASVEATIGYTLFQRTSAGMRPTESGLCYLQYAREAVALEDRVLSDLEKIWRRKQKTLITMGFSHLRNAIVLPKSLMDFLTDRPDVQTMFRIARDDELIQGLLEGTIDFAMLTMPLSSKLPRAAAGAEDVRGAAAHRGAEGRPPSGEGGAGSLQHIPLSGPLRAAGPAVHSGQPGERAV